MAGVTELEFRGLHVKFSGTAERGTPSMPLAPNPQPPVKDLTDEQHQKLSLAALELDELQTREDQLAEALITDPLRYEELMRNGDLTDGMDASNDGDEDES